MAANATFTFSDLIAPALNAQGQAVGLQLTGPQTQILLSVSQRISNSQTLVNVSDFFNLNFGAIAVPLIILISASAPVLIGLTVTGIGGTNVFSQFYALVGNDATHPVTAGSVTAKFVNTAVDVVICG